MPKAKGAQVQIKQIGEMLDDSLILVQPDGAIIAANTPAVRHFGEDLVGNSIFDVIKHPDIKDLLAEAVAGKTNLEFKYEPSEIVQREFRLRLKRLADGPIALLILDMTLQRNLEKVRRDFVANVSHELRSPLTSLVGFVETILSGEVSDSEMRTRFLKIMDEEAKRMSRLVDDLLSLSQVEVEEHIVPDKTVQLFELLHSVKDSLAVQANQKNMKIIVRQDGCLNGLPPPLIFGNHDEITEVFVNLLENAVKYGFDNSEIILAIYNCGQGTVKIDVINEGEGVEEKHLPRLTERFYRVDKARSRKIGGTGLGLAIVKHIINRHRGQLTITSTLGKTTKFSVDFPLVPGS